MYVVLFFFSSRRRHTRLQGDWSSDVCSSDLIVRRVPEQYDIEAAPGKIQVRGKKPLYIRAPGAAVLLGNNPLGLGRLFHQVRQVDAVTQRADEINIGRGRWAYIENPQGFFAAHALEQLAPPAGIARHALMRRSSAAGLVLATKPLEHFSALLPAQSLAEGAAADAARSTPCRCPEPVRAAISDSSTLPLMVAFSSIDNLSAMMSPFTTAESRSSIRPVARILPSTRPYITTSPASKSAITRAFGPIVRRLSGSEIVPSTTPSMYRSSLPDT